jgi:hypothetical protein
MKENFTKKRSEPRKKADKYLSVEFITSDFIPTHLLKSSRKPPPSGGG